MICRRTFLKASAGAASQPPLAISLFSIDCHASRPTTIGPERRSPSPRHRTHRSPPRKTPLANASSKKSPHASGGDLTYQELLAALLLAGVRNINPQPVGFKFHAVLVAQFRSTSPA